MGNCGGSNKDDLDIYMKKYHPSKRKVDQSNYELNKKAFGGLNGNVFSSEPITINPDKDHTQETEKAPKIKINEQILREGARLGNRSSVSTFTVNQAKNPVISVKVEQPTLTNDANPFDVNLLDPKDAILFSQTLHKFNFNDFQVYTPRHVVVTRNALRIYENKQASLSTYGKPMVAIPLTAVTKVERVKMDVSDDQRLEKPDQNTALLNKNMFEIQLRDEFLPIYTHLQYQKVFKDTSVAMGMSPGKPSARGSLKSASPARNSNVSQSKFQASPSRQGGVIDMHKKTGNELRESPSKNAKIVMRYIKSYHDVGPVVSQTPVTYSELVEMASNMDKKEIWVRSDLRLIFAIEDGQILEEAIEQLSKAVSE